MNNKPIILADFHHAGLLNSLIMLFEGRLGGKVYRPIGMQWYEEGYWAVYDHPATAAQYLNIGSVPEDGTPPLNESNLGIASPTLHGVREAILCNDIGGGEPNKAITLKEFKRAQFDILIASLPQHIEPFKKLISLYQPQAKLIFQIGNSWNVDAGSVKNVMASANVDIPKDVNGIIYHQEFDLKTFHYEPPNPESKKIYSFINCLGVVDIYKKDWELFLELERLMPDWEFKSFGGQTRDGAISGGKELADKMREATFIFHCKTDGDGYGHVIHNAAAVGRPLITRRSDYTEKLADSLLKGIGPTYIDVESKSAKQIAEQINAIYNFSGGEGYGVSDMSKYIYQSFKETVNFDAEEQMIRKFLENLL